ncbi:MAG TPA: S1C family serine protease, partial [Acidimicrobiales bacterium]
MSFDDADDEDAPGFRPPPHPDDRLWRHPSEVGEHDERVAVGLRGGSHRRARALRSRTWGVALTAGAAGVALGVVLVALVFGGGGSSDDDGPAAGGVLPTVPTQLADRVSPAVVSLVGDDDGAPAGSGVVVRDDGIVLTSAALVAGDAAVDVRLADGSVVRAEVVGRDPVTGIGVLDLPGQGHATAALAASSALVVGAPAFSVGAPAAGGTADATAGVIGAGRSYVGGAEGTATALEGVVEVDGEAAPWALGGPVVDDRGAVLGVTTAVDAEGDAAASYITPAEISRKVADDLLVVGHARHGWLGIQGQDVADDPSATAGAFAGRGGDDGPRQHGAVVSSVDAGSPAQAVGLRRGDVIVELEGRQITGIADLVMWLRSRSPGDSAEIV